MKIPPYKKIAMKLKMIMDKKFLNILFRYSLIILGFIMFSGYIWLRFIRERLPKDIPFPFLSGFGLLCLIYICSIYLYIVYSLLKKGSTSNEISVKFVENFYMPLMAFDKYLKEKPFIKNLNTKVLVFLSKQKFWQYTDGLFFFYFFQIFPRVVLITAFVIDAFYFHYIYFLYKVLLIGLLLFIGRYLRYSFKALKEQMIEEHSHKVKVLLEFYTALHILGEEDNEDEYDYDEDFNVDNRLSVPLDKFIDHQIEFRILEMEMSEYEVRSSIPYFKYFLKEYHKLGYKTDHGEDYHDFIFKLDRIVKDILDISYIVAYLNDKTGYKCIGYLKILIFINYFLIWLYIIIVSMPNLNIDYNFLIDVLEMLEEAIEKKGNPFI